MISPVSAGNSSGVLRRELGVFGSVMMGMGSIVGTGVFVSIGIAAGIAGPSVIIAIALAALVAVFNGLSSAQLAASRPVSGGTYEYGYAYASPAAGWTAGWMFLCAKSASAATAALGLAGYLINAFGGEASLGVPAALTAVAVLTGVILTGLKRTNRVNIAIVSATLFSLIFFVLTGIPSAVAGAAANLRPFFGGVAAGGPSPLSALLHACALMFVAYTGYGRIATMGEEVKNPRRTIPRAIVVTLVISMILYVAVGAVGVASVGAGEFYAATTRKTATLEVVARGFGIPAAPWIMAVGALTAMTGVLLNLILGLSRVLLAMGRRGDMPSAAARLDKSGATPYVAVVVIGAVIAGLVLIGNVRTTWSFSAFTVLIYYAITNYCALKLPSHLRLYPRILAWAGLVSCLMLAFFVETAVWAAGVVIIVLGLLWHFAAQKLFSKNT